MRIMKYFYALILLQFILVSTSFAETLMRDGVVVSYELGAEEPGIQNDNRDDKVFVRQQ